MANIDSLVTDLGAASAGLTRASHAAAAAVTAVERISTRASEAGFTGITQSLGQVGAAARKAHVGISTLSALTVETQAEVAAVFEQVSPQQAIAALAPIADRLRDLQQRTAASIGQVDRAGQLATAALRGGQPGPMLARLDGVRRLLVEAAARIEAGRQHAETALAQAADVGDLGNRPRVPVYRTRDHRHPKPRRGSATAPSDYRTVPTTQALRTVWRSTRQLVRRSRTSRTGAAATSPRRPTFDRCPV